MIWNAAGAKIGESSYNLPNKAWIILKGGNVQENGMGLIG